MIKYLNTIYLLNIGRGLGGVGGVGGHENKVGGLRNSLCRYMDPKYQTHTYIRLYALIFKYHLLT